MMTNLLDLGFITLVLTFIVSFYGFFLFLWWWRFGGHASEMFIYFMLLLLATAFSAAAQAVSRLYFLVGGSDGFFDALITSTWWNLRSIPALLILVIIIWQMTKRARRTVDRIKAFDASPMVERRKGERRADTAAMPTKPNTQ